MHMLKIIQPKPKQKSHIFLFLAPCSLPCSTGYILQSSSFSQANNKLLKEKKSDAIKVKFQSNAYGQVVWVELKGKEHG